MERGDGGGKNALPPPLVFFFKYLQNDKVWLCPFMTFSYYLFWTFLPNFLRKFWLAHELLWFCQSGTNNSKTNFFSKRIFFFFLKQLFLQNISSIHSAEVVNMLFFIWNHIFLLVFENKYVRIGNFVVFLSGSMEVTSNRFFYLLCKTICFYLSFFFL